VSYLHAAGHRLEYEWLSPHAARRQTQSPPVLVFLHEGLGSTARWKDFPRCVVDATGFTALVYSRYGYGKSDPLAQPRTVDYMQKEALETLPEVLDALSIRAPLLIGHSDGASISIIYAGAGAGRWPVRGLVLMAPHVFVEDVTVASIAQTKTAFETTDLGAKLSRYHDDPVGAFRGWSDVWLHPDFRAWNIEPCLPRITAPVLLIQGDDDQYGTMAQIEAIERQLGGPVETVALARCAHSPHVDQEEATLAAVSGFVESVKR
jgi:pimeloyl-ACP methyl ester carboxylesterase